LPPRPPPFPYTTLFRSGSPDILFACRQRFIQAKRHLPRDVAGIRIHRPQAAPGWFLTRGVSDGLSTRILNGSGKPVIRSRPVVRSEEHTSELQSRGHLV